MAPLQSQVRRFALGWLFVAGLAGVGRDVAIASQPPRVVQRRQLPHGIVALAQGDEGFLWIATSRGLMRFDGVRFVADPDMTSALSFAPASAGGLWVGLRQGGGVRRIHAGRLTPVPVEGLAQDEDVTAMLEDRAAQLWLGTGMGLSRVDRGHITREVLPGQSPAKRAVAALLESRDGTLWCAWSGGLARRRTGQWESVVADEPIVALTQDSRGRVWAGENHRHLYRFDPDGSRVVFTDKDGLGSGYINQLSHGEDEDVWIGTALGLTRFAEQATPVFSRFAVADGLVDPDVTGLATDSEGGVWIGSRSGMLLRLAAARVRAWTAEAGLPGGVTFSVLVDKAGVVWSTSRDGLTALKPTANGFVASTVTAAQGLPTYCARGLAQTPDGALWIGTCDAGLIRFKEGAFTRVAGLATTDVSAMVPDRTGTLWVATSDGALATVNPGGPPTVTHQFVVRGKKGPLVAHDLWAATDGSLLMATDEGLFRRRGTSVERILPDNALLATALRSLWQDPAGTLWIGTNTQGLLRLSGTVVQRLGRADGLPSDLVSGVVGDSGGQLWVATDAGVARLNPVSERPAVINYGLADGMGAQACSLGPQPTIARSLDGTVWFSTTLGLTSFAPAPEKRPTRRAPPLIVEELHVDGALHTFIDEAMTLEAPPGRGEVDVRFTVATFAAPARVRFRYQMAGYDRGWVDAGDRRVAYYTNLPPGLYRFQVQAREDDDDWHSDAAFSLRLSPHVYQRRSFWAFCALVVCAGLAAGVRARMRNQRARFRAILDERNRIARDLHDSLAQSFSALGFQLSRLGGRLREAPPETRGVLEDARRMVGHCRKEVQHAIWNLRREGDDERSFLDSLGALTKRPQQAGAPATVRLVVEGPQKPLSSMIEQQILFVAQEALTNALSHSQASTIVVTIRFEKDNVTLCVSDNGRGMPLASQATGEHFGLLGMRERAERMQGTLTVESTPEKGTVVVLNVPLDGSREASA